MVLLALDEFFRSFFQFNSLPRSAPDDAADSPPRPTSLLVFCTPEVDSVCCCHLLSTFLNSRLLFLDSQWDCGNVALDIEFVSGIPDVLAWIDRHLEYHVSHAPTSSPGLPSSSAYRLPFYDRILFIGLGGLADEDELDDEDGDARQTAGLTATLFAAVTDLFLHKAVRLEALEELRRQRRRERAERLRRQPFAFFNARDGDAGEAGADEAIGRAAASGAEDAYNLDGAGASGVLTPEDEERVRRIEVKFRNAIKIAVLDARRPVHTTLIRDGRWMMPMEEAEQEALDRRRRERLEAGKGHTSLLAAGVYRSKPCAAVLAKVLEPLYEVESSAYAFAGATAAAAFLHEEWLSSDDYNDLIMAIKDINVSTFPYIEDDDNNGLLPLLRNGCLRDSLSVSRQLLFLGLGSSHASPAAASGEVSRAWMSQQQSNELRVQCGLECKDMVNPFSGLAASQQRVVYDYLRQTLQLRDCYCLNWAKDRGNLPSVPNVDTAFLLQALLARPGSQDAVGASVYRVNAIDALQLLTRITSTATREQTVVLQQLEKAQSLVVHHLLQLFRHLDLAVLSHARGGVLLVTLRHPRAFLLHPAYLRTFALLCSLKQAGGEEEKRLPVVLHVCVEAPAPGGERSILYACTPNADAENPDLFPFVLHLLVSSGDLGGDFTDPRRKHGKRRGREQRPEAASAVARCVKRDGGCPHMLHVSVGRLGADVQKQVAAVYVNEMRRRAEEDARDDDDDLDFQGEEDPEEEVEADTETGIPSQEEDDKEQRDPSNWATQREDSEGSEDDRELSEHEAKRRHSESVASDLKTVSRSAEPRRGGAAPAW
ncbi:conserved hypothetical protein [Neospora caninum Liverpool]|uniref:Uncharacterized protein n=1 Tax=Neospora caninum (strain Liverpool) TaxID=572307 RepID=F0VJ30_NEOCL|nr:conserved hypothetical protein [Neospora caninum Liverpool]CBZ53741.1 conserved hypothetical protein [Neospora caninum Liverpool]CEL67732.1 TPA: hypothetical protein BN1204_035230 [Neospora caninum Liverpool]|eukprot:XP_003883773.1 conserved hypothetical protein [Neospora caninum Liverpool]